MVDISACYHAAPLTFITGSSIASPSDYRGLGAQFLDNHTVLLQLTGAQYFVVAEHSGAGFPYHVHAAGGVQVGGIELAVNVRAHTELIAVGIPTSASAAAVDALGGTSVRTAFQDVMSPNVSNGDAPLHLIWHDVVNLWLVQVWDILHWQYDGYMVDGITSTNNYEQLFPDGWFECCQSYSSGYDYSSGRRYDAYDTTSALFWNPVFCPPDSGGTTYIEVAYNTSAGYYDGSRGVSIDTYDYGGCWNWIGSYWQWG